MTTWFGGLIAVGVLVRLLFLGSDSIWLDEAFSIALSLRHTSGELLAGALDTRHPPLYYIVLRGALLAGGSSEVVARLPSALASVCSLPLLFVLARRLCMSHVTALTAVVLLALAPLEIWYAQDARMYALLTMTAILFAIGLTLNSIEGLVLTALALAAGLYLDFTMVPLSLALTGVWLVWWFNDGRSTSHLTKVIAASVLGWLSFRPLWGQLATVFNHLGGVTFFTRFGEATGLRIASATSAAIILAVASLGVVAAAAALWSALRNERAASWLRPAIAVLFILVTAALAVPRFYSAKQILVTGWPFVVLLAAWAMNPFERRHGTTAHLLAAAVAVSLAAAVFVAATPRADWRGVVAHMNGHDPRQTAVVLDPSWNAIAYGHYSPRIRAAGAVPPLPDAGDVCLVAERFGHAPPTSPSEAWLDEHWRLVNRTGFARLEVRCYAPQ
jgi:uncharacterized membrane protein